MQDRLADALDALCLAAAPSLDERGRDLEAELARLRLLAHVLGRSPEVTLRLGRFDILRCVGRGGMGKVFEARDCASGARLALKVLHDPADDALARLKREFRALCDVSHPNLVAMYELHLAQSLPFFTMELVEGQSLRERLEAQVGFDVRFVVSSLLQLVEGLQAIHTRSTVHGDVKPANILLRDDGRLVAVDFGVARALGDTRSTHGSGTVAYMAPERARGGGAEAAADWYAVGAVLEEMLAQTGEPRAERDHADLQILRRLRTGLLDPEPRSRLGARDVLSALGVAPRTRTSLAPDHEAAFVGRGDELALLQRALARIDGGPVACLVSGAAGLGKTALIERFLALPELAHALVLRGRCYEDESVPYKGIDGVVEELATHLQSLPVQERQALLPAEVASLLRVFPALRRGGLWWPDVASSDAASTPHEPRHARRIAFAVLSELLVRLAARRTLVVFIDDLQWGDADTAALLEHLLSAPERPALMWLASHRSDGFGDCVRVLDTAAVDATRIALGPLDATDCAQLAREVSRDGLDPHAYDSLMHESGGSPLLLHALLRAGPAATGAPHQERSFHQLIATALADLDPAAREVLALVSLAGGPIATHVVTEAADSAEPIWKWVTALRSRRLVRTLVRDGRSSLVPHHDRVREAVASLLQPEERRRYHARLAQAASVRSLDDPEFLAQQYLRAGLLADAALHAEHAADRARKAMALQRACDLYAQALACVAPARPVALVSKLADAAAAAGNLNIAAPLYLEAARTEPENGWTHRLRAAEMYLLRGAEAEGMALLRPALREAGIPLPTSTAHALGVGALSLVRHHFGRDHTSDADVPDDAKTEIAFRVGYLVTLHNPLGMALLLWSGARARRHGSAAQRGRAIAITAHVYCQFKLRSPAAQDAMVSEALRLTQHDPLARTVALTCKALIAFGRSDCHAALAALDMVRRLIVDEGVDARWMLSQVHTVVASVCVMAGDFARIRSFAADVEQEALEIGNRPVVSQIQSSRAWAGLAAGDPEAMRHYAAETMQAWHAKRVSPLYGIAVWGECHRLLYQGETELAFARMRQEAPGIARSGLQRVQGWSVPLAFLWGNIELSASQRCGDVHFRAAQRHARQLEREPIAWGRACATLLRAGMAQRAGHTGLAREAYRESQQGFARLGIEGCAAAAAYRAVQLLGECSLPELEVPWFASQSIAEPAKWVRMLAP